MEKNGRCRTRSGSRQRGRFFETNIPKKTFASIFSGQKILFLPPIPLAEPRRFSLRRDGCPPETVRIAGKFLTFVSRSSEGDRTKTTTTMYSFQELLDITERELSALKYPAQPERLYEPVAYSLEEGGKRLRPVALLMACDLFGGGIAAAKPAALAVEVFHNFTLLHDDIMDRSDMRRGKPAVHTRWNDNVAILSGDAMMILAYRLLCGSDEAVLPRLLSVFNATALGVCEGQQYDMDFETRDEVTVGEYLRMIELKTAVLLAGALKMGALCGGAKDDEADRLYRFGIAVGLAFQLQDDLLDTYGDAAVFGKPIGGDILAGKKTFLLTTALGTADEATRARLLALLGDGAAEPSDKIASVRAVYDALSVREATQKAIAAYFDEAERMLDGLGLPEERTQPLRELARRLLNRNR